MTGPLLSVEGLRIAFPGVAGDRVVVDGVDLSVERGETVALVGESGSGKTLTALALLGLVPAPGRVIDGRLRFDGRDLQRATPADLRGLRGNRMSMVFQEPMTSLNPLMKVGRQVAEPLRLHRRLGSREAAREVVALLGRVGLPEPERVARSYPHTLSGGMRQRVVIAMALACSPEMVIADEPTTALDVTVQRQVLDLMTGLVAESGSALLLVTHDLAVVGERADRIVVMRAGRVVEHGRTASVLTEPAATYTRVLLDAVPSSAGPERTQPSGPVVLEARGLTKSFRRGVPPAVDDVSFVLRRGRTLGLVGESGSGKSTTARLALRLLAADAGQVLLDDTDITAVRGRVLRQARRRMQLVFQDPYASLDPRFTIGEVISEPLRAHRIGDRAAQADRVAELLTSVGLTPDHAARSPRQLSGGQRQRVAIARALAVRPDVVVCDEAVSSLDVSVQRQVLDLLRGLQEQLGVAYLFISHDLGVVRELSDDVAVMRRGVVVEAGQAEQVLAEPEHEYTRSLLAAVPRLGVRR